MKSTRLTADCTPHWPGMLCSLEQVARELEGERPDAVAITGGEDVAMFAAFDDRVMRFGLAAFVPTSTTLSDLEAIAFCYRNTTGTYVAGQRDAVELVFGGMGKPRRHLKVVSA